MNLYRESFLDLRQLEHFVAVADEQHFTRAAQKVHIVQSALSTSIRALEIELGAQLANTVATTRPSYWFYLAAAFGQKYSAFLEQKQTGSALQSARDNALESARKAVQIDPIFKQRLLHVSDPDGVDNDLADLRNDPDFLNIVGQRPGR